MVSSLFTELLALEYEKAYIYYLQSFWQPANAMSRFHGFETG